jgi:putative membrane protein
MNPLYIKAIHIIFVVTWFAGLFYMPRLFIYHREAQDKPEPDKSILSEQFKKMQKPLWYGITWPSMVLTLIFGFWLVYLFNYWVQPWFLLKLALVVGLILYHMSLHFMYKDHQSNIFKNSSLKLRAWNEIATLFLVSIVFIVVLKDTLNFLWGILGLIILSGAILLGIKIYKRNREQKDNTIK